MPANIYRVNHTGELKFIEQLFPGEHITLFHAIDPRGQEMSLHVECDHDDVKTNMYFFEGTVFTDINKTFSGVEYLLEVPHASEEQVPFRHHNLGILALLAEHRHLISTS